MKSNFYVNVTFYYYILIIRKSQTKYKMGLDNFNWKSLFVNDDGIENKKQEQTTPITNNSNNKFPETNVAFPSQQTNINHQTPVSDNSNSVSNNPFLNEVLGVYEKGFDSLNQSGFDFFELYKSVQSVGASNPQAYQMAFTMGKTINPELSKAILLDKAKFYIDEIQKVYQKYDAIGNSKKQELNTAVSNNKATLTKTIAELESQIEKLQADLHKNKEQLSKVDANNSNQFSEFQLKIDANNLAKDTILNSINTVITGINQYL